MNELEQKIMDAYQSAPDLMGGLMHVYHLGLEGGHSSAPSPQTPEQEDQ